MSKIFQIGFNQCGNDFIAQVLGMMGRRTTFWDHGRIASVMLQNFKNQERLLKGYDESYDAFVDMENVDENMYAHVLFYKMLDKQYPHSKFILNTSDIEKWVERRRHAGTYLKRAMASSGCATEEEMMERWRYTWKRHVADVMEYFKDREDDLCIFHVDSDPPQSLLEFVEPMFRDVFHHALYAPVVERCGVVWDMTAPFSLQDILCMTCQKPLGTSTIILTNIRNRCDVTPFSDLWERFPILYFEEENAIPCLVMEFGMTCVFAPVAIVARITALIRDVASLSHVPVVAAIPHALK